MEQERAIFNLRGYAETIVASMPSGLLLLDADLRVLAVNPAFLDAFTCTRPMSSAASWPWSCAPTA
jgi:PAS domain-containing protein